MKGIVGLDESSFRRGRRNKSQLLLDTNWVAGEKLDSSIWNSWQLTDLIKSTFLKEESGFIVLVTLMCVSVYVYVVSFKEITSQF